MDPEEEARLSRLMELRSQAEASKLEEEKKAAAAATGGKKPPAGKKPEDTATIQPSAELTADEIAELEAPRIKSMDDMPDREFQLYDYKKTMADLKMGDCGVGQILGAMLYQIGLDKGKQEKDSMNEELFKEG